jgi:hypothetical protein
MATEFDDMPLEQIRAKQNEFLDALESEAKKGNNAPIDPVGVGQRIGLNSILTSEFIVYWVNMGRLERAWLKVADQLREQSSYTPLKLPPGMVPDSESKPRTIFSEEQRQVYRELWQDVLNVAERRHTAQIPFDDRKEGIDFHDREAEIGYVDIRKIDKLAPYLDREHYHLLREYFTAYCNYHQYRISKYRDIEQQDPSRWTQQDAILYGKVFTSGLVEVEAIFREAFTTPDKDLFPTEVIMGSKYSFGNISGQSIVNVDSILTRVTQNIGSAPNMDEDSKKQLGELIEQLKVELQKIPPEKKDEADAVAKTAEDLVKAGTEVQPNKVLVQITADGLKKAAENILSVMPPVLGIVKIVFQIAGVPLP